MRLVRLVHICGSRARPNYFGSLGRVGGSAGEGARGLGSIFTELILPPPVRVLSALAYRALPSHNQRLNMLLGAGKNAAPHTEHLA